jgi:hypothetical protein
MKWLACLLVVAACGADSSGGDDDGEDPQPGPRTLAELGFGGRLAVVGDCIVVAQGSDLTCVPSAGGEARSILHVEDRIFVEPVADGDAIVASSLPLDFGPDGDRTLRIDRVTLDGAITTLGSAFSGFGAGEGLAIGGDKVIFSTGGSADLLAVPRAGGATTRLASDSGNFGDVAVVGADAFYVNGFMVFRQALAGSQDDPEAALPTPFFDALLASDATTLVAVGPSLEQEQQTLVVSLPPGPAIAPLAGRAGRAVVAGGIAHVIAGGDVHAIELATGVATPEVTGESVGDVALTTGGLVWITDTGAVRAQSK